MGATVTETPTAPATSGEGPVPPSRRSFGQRLFGPPSPWGLAGAVLLGWASLTPSLMPRGWMIQGVLLGLNAAVGYGLGVGLRAAATPLVPPAPPRRPGVRRIALAGLLVGFTLAARVWWPAWQDAGRARVGMAGVPPDEVWRFCLLGLVVATVLVLLGRGVAHLLVALDRWLERRSSRWVAWLVLALVVGLVAWVLAVDVVGKGFARWADGRFAGFDTQTYPGDEQPTTALRSGSAESLVAWEDLGREGRTFVAGGPDATTLAAWAGEDALDPIRLYVGLAVDPDPQVRAQTAVAELDRSGAWDRELVVVWVPTGTGWIDPDAAEVVEHLHDGDVAIVSSQYSFLPSWISFMVDQEKSADNAVALVDAVVAAWSARPADQRPGLVVFGESLGSFGAESAMGGGDLDASVAAAEATDGMVLLGPTNANVLWEQLVAARAPGSPHNRPAVATHPEIVVGNRPGDLDPHHLDRERGRIAYYHHPSDPIGYWNWETLWRPQEWTAEPAYDVNPLVDWYPFVTFTQVVGDLVAGFGAPTGYGHNYAVDFPDVWASVVAPPGWTAADSDALREHLRLDRTDPD